MNLKVVLIQSSRQCSRLRFSVRCVLLLEKLVFAILVGIFVLSHGGHCLRFQACWTALGLPTPAFLNQLLLPCRPSYLLRPVESSPHIFCDHTSHSSSVHFGCSSSPPQPPQTSSLFCWLPLHESEYICTLLSILCLQFLLAPNSILIHIYIN